MRSSWELCAQLGQSVEPCVELWRRRRRFVRCHRRVSRNRGAAEKCTGSIRLWTLSPSSVCLRGLPPPPQSLVLWRAAVIADELRGQAGIIPADRGSLLWSGLLDIYTPSSSGWPCAVKWIVCVCGHWSWLWSVSRTSAQLAHTRNRLGCHFGHICYFCSEFEDLRARRGCLIC